jgi:hypothetical protein
MTCRTAICRLSVIVLLLTYPPPATAQQTSTPLSTVALQNLKGLSLRSDDAPAVGMIPLTIGNTLIGHVHGF